MGILSIVYGSTTIDLDSSSTVLLKYVPKPPTGKTSMMAKDSITETAEVIFTGANVAAISSLVQALQGAFRMAREYQERKTGDRVYVHFLPVGAADTRRSEILDGRVTLDDGALDVSQWGAKQVHAAVILERGLYWESTTESAIALSNGNGTNVTSGLNVFNANDGVGTSPNKRNNFVDIAAGVILGNVAAPVRIELTNQYNDANRLYNVYMSQNIFSAPASFNHWLEGEAPNYGGTPTANAAASGGFYGAFSWVGDGQSMFARWLLNTAYLANAAGRWFKVLAGFYASPASGIRVQCKITFPAGSGMTQVAASQEILLSASAHLQDIGTLQIPPWLAGETSLADVDLALLARCTGGGFLGIDYLQITPLDGYRILTPRGYGAAYQVRIVDDGINQVVWTDGWSGGGKSGHYTTIGEPLLLYPGKAQRFYFLQSGDAWDIDIARLVNVKMYYRPRYEGI